jgi:hypothetical protein
MTKPTNLFRYFNSLPEVIGLTVVMYLKFPPSLRNVEDLPALDHLQGRQTWSVFWGAVAAISLGGGNL